MQIWAWDNNEISTIDWSQSMSQTFEYYEVDPSSWKDIRRIENVKTCSIIRDLEDDTLGSASFEINGNIDECYIRVYMVVSQNGHKEKIALGTFLVQSSSNEYDGKALNTSVDGYTPLIELSEKHVPIGFCINKNSGNGQAGATKIMDTAYILTKEHARAPVVETYSEEVLRNDFISDPDEKWISYIKALLNTAKCTFELDGYGRIMFSPFQKVDGMRPIWTYNDDNSSILYPELSIDRDIFGIPNVVEIFCSTATKTFYAKAVNDDPNSPVSTVARGREITERITEWNLPGNPTNSQAEEYAKSYLKEISTVKYKIKYTHAYSPVRLGDCVMLNYTSAGINNLKGKVISQTITCSTGCKVSETAEFTEKLWG